MSTNVIDQKEIFAKASETEEGCLAALMDAVKGFSENELAMIKKAYELSRDVHSTQKRLSGQPYIIHPLSVAKILADLGMDCGAIVASLLHDTIEDTTLTYEDIEKGFGAEIAALVDGVTKIGKVPLSTQEEQQAENIRKMLLAMSQDIRVIIIKLADRLHNMRTLMFKSPQKRRDISCETIEIYAPIAHRLGIRPIKEELEDLAISYLDPVAYEEIRSSLEAQSQSRNEYLSSIQERVKERIDPLVKGAQVNGRIKSVHGIFRKMYMQNKNFDEIYDIYAIRIIVDTIIDCYNCLGIIHDMFRPIPGRFKDYISTPKPNMYQSLHTTVIEKEGIPFEVQIRTWEMHHTAEYGIAAHWKYKLGMSGGKAKFEERLAWIRQLLESQNESEDVEDIVRTIKSDLAPEEVYVFTPKGDVFNLPKGATVIDFAYAIHSAVGNRMVGAKVDGRIVPIDYEVRTGQIVDILTSSQAGKGPSRDWLKIVKTSQARSKIRQWYKKEKREENIAEGKAEIEREFKRNFIRLSSDESEQFLTKLAEHQHCNSLDDFYASIGYGGLSVTRMMPRIKDEYSKLVKAKVPEAIPEIKPEKKRTRSKDGVVVEGVDNCLVKFSRCCNPLPGDDIIGFITRGHGVSIHTKACTNVPDDISKSAEPERWISAYWDSNVKEDFKCTLHITCLKRMGMLADLSGQLASMHIMINDINTRNYSDGRCSFFVTVSVNGVEHLENVMEKLSRIDDVLAVERTGV